MASSHRGETEREKTKECDDSIPMAQKNTITFHRRRNDTLLTRVCVTHCMISVAAVLFSCSLDAIHEP